MINVSGWQKWLIIGLLIFVFAAVIAVSLKSCKQIDADQDNQLVNAGISQERAGTQGEVLNHVEKARDAIDNPSDAERNIVCSKYDRNCTKSDQ